MRWADTALEETAVIVSTPPAKARCARIRPLDQLIVKTLAGLDQVNVRAR
jgi:hypothetical protein